ncbi:MAG TPA: permease, partial [Micromonosporaceae bacterium]|nr:permease [Micromonosporaceae bacterium]
MGTRPFFSFPDVAIQFTGGHGACSKSTVPGRRAGRRCAISTFLCSSCGRKIAAAPECPHCGAPQSQWVDELARIERSIADLKARDAELLQEQRRIAMEMQAALFRRDALAHTKSARGRQATRPRRILRRRPGRRPPTADPGTPPPRIPRQPPLRPPPQQSPPAVEVVDLDEPGGRPEASSREVQNVLLGLSALLLGVAAFVFAALTIDSLSDLSRLAILVTATVLMLATAPMVAGRRLVATAETIAAVGLLLVLIDGYALWTVEGVREGGLISASVFAGFVFAATAAIAAPYAGATGLSAPRYATVLAAQPILPLLAYNQIGSATGWAFVFTAVAVLDLYLGRLLTQQGRLVLPPWLAPPAGQDGPDGPLSPGGSRHRGARPESAPEETDEVLRPEPAGPADWLGADAAGGVAASRDDDGGGDSVVRWLWEVTWGLHALAVVAALGFAVAALVDAATVPAAGRAGLALVLAAVVGLAGALAVRQPPLPDIAAGILTLAVIGAAGRIAAVALPGRALLLIAAIIAVTGLGVRAVPPAVRRGPQFASTIALVVIGIVVAGNALEAALALINAAVPMWRADLAAYPAKLAAAVGPTGWQLAAAAILLTIAAVLALPEETRREFAVAGGAFTALAMPASLGLPWVLAPWPPVIAAIGIAIVGLSARTKRAAQTHVLAAGIVGLTGAGAALARPGLTAAVLFVLAAAGVLVAVAARSPAPPDGPVGPMAGTVGDWAAGGAAFAWPGAVAGFVAAAAPGEPGGPAATPTILAATYLAVCTSLGYAAMAQVADRKISTPLVLGTGFGALAAAAAGVAAPDATAPDAWLGALLLVAALLLFLTPTIDANRRADQWYDGADLAAAAATAALVATLARTASILVPGTVLVAAAALVLAVAIGVRAMPGEWRRGPSLGIAASGGLVAVFAGWPALRGGVQVLITPGAVWNADLPATTSTGTGWQAPLTLVLLAGAAAVALPRPWSYDISVACVGLATIGTPAAFGLPWWSAIIIGSAVAAGYGAAAVVASDPRAGVARAVLAGAVGLHAVASGLARPGTTAVALSLVTLICVVVAGLARAVTPGAESEPPGEIQDVPAAPRRVPMPRHLAQIGGVAAGGALLAAPGALAATAAAVPAPATVVLAAALGATSLGLAVVALIRHVVPEYLPHATVGIAGGATAVALASLPTGLPTGLYAATAVLLAVIAELVRAATPAPPVAEPVRLWSRRIAAVVRWPAPTPGRWSVSPAAGAATAALVPAALAVAALAPALMAALVVPFQTLDRIWDGPPPELLVPPAEAVAASNVLAALLLTIAAALASIGFTRGRAGQAVPVVLPGAAVTLLITPVSLGVGWPQSTMAALLVFTISMLGLALTPPPRPSERARPLRITRAAVFGIGLAAGGAGLAGSLATESLTLFTLGSAVGVGAVAAGGGLTRLARVLGWLFAAVMAQLFVVTAGLAAD